jgi:hypothetical protein
MDKILSAEAENLAFSYIGTAKYSVLEAVKSYFGLNRNPEAWQCVELVKRILLENGVPTDCEDTPRALVEYLLKDGRILIHID